MGDTIYDKGMENSTIQGTIPISAMSEDVERPDVLEGTTYKIKPPVYEHAMYITINHMILNLGEPDEQRRPFEIFINSKNMEHFQWVVALTRMMSAIFRKGGDFAFMVEEMKVVEDPQGGYFIPGHGKVGSTVAEIGMVVEKHLKKIGALG